MIMEYRAKGQTWDVFLSEEGPERGHPGLRPVIFHCKSNTSWGWRVVELSASELPADGSLDEVPRVRIAELFDRSEPFDYPTDPKAKQHHIGDGPGR